MKLIKPLFEILDYPTTLELIEKAGRTCYKSENKITKLSWTKFIEMLIKNGHESVLEHEKITVKFICDRGVSHELVRHRLSSFSQESTRYCDYSKDKFDNQLTFIIPCWIDNIERAICEDRAAACWYNAMERAEQDYSYLLSDECEWSPQQARSVLPNSLKTEIIITSNLRHWREIFRQRTSKAAHPQMRELMCPLLDELKKKLPIIFDDITYKK